MGEFSLLGEGSSMAMALVVLVVVVMGGLFVFGVVVNLIGCTWLLLRHTYRLITKRPREDYEFFD